MTKLWFECRNDKPAWVVKDGEAEQGAFEFRTTAVLFSLLVDDGRLGEAVQWKERYGI